MSQCVPSWDMDDINPNHAVFKFGYEVAELTWENGQVAMQELGSRRVPTKSQPTTSWDKPSAAETLESIVDQATLQPYCKTQVAAEEDELVPWLHHRIPIVAAGSLNAATPTRTSDALVPISNNRTDERFADQAHRPIESARDVGCSTLVGSCSSNPSAFMDTRVARGGESTKPAHDLSSRRDMSVSRNRTFVTLETRDSDLGDCLLTSTSTELPESTSSGRDCSKSRSPDDSACHGKTQDENAIKEKKRGKTKASISNRRRRTAAIHNQSERKRRDKITQRMKTLQKLVPNSSKTDKASMLDEVVEYIKQLQAQVHMMNMSPMMSFVMQQQQQQQRHQQQQMHMSMINSMCMGTGMGMGGIDMNTMGLSNISPGFHPSIFMHMPSWNNHTNNQAVNTNTMTANPMSAFLACRPQPMNMDSYNRMAALYQHMLNQSYGPFSKN